MATCPNCQVSSRVDPDAIEVTTILLAKPVGTWSLAGAQMKTVATTGYRMTCTRCGWHIDGHLDLTDGGFVGRVDSQFFPPGSGAPRAGWNARNREGLEA